MNLTNQEKADILVQALPYIQRYNDKILVVKFGGNAMTSEATNGSTTGMTVNKSVSLTSGGYLTVAVNSSIVVTVKSPVNMTGYVVYIGSNSASIAASTTTSLTLDANGVAWN